MAALYAVDNDSPNDLADVRRWIKAIFIGSIGNPVETHAEARRSRVDGWRQGSAGATWKCEEHVRDPQPVLGQKARY